MTFPQLQIITDTPEQTRTHPDSHEGTQWTGNNPNRPKQQESRGNQQRIYAATTDSVRELNYKNEYKNARTFPQLRILTKTSEQSRKLSESHEITHNETVTTLRLPKQQESQRNTQRIYAEATYVD